METKEVRDVYLERGYKVTLNDVLEAMQASDLDGEEMLSLEDFLTQGSKEVSPICLFIWDFKWDNGSFELATWKKLLCHLL